MAERSGSARASRAGFGSRFGFGARFGFGFGWGAERAGSGAAAAGFDAERRRGGGRDPAAVVLGEVAERAARRRRDGRVVAREQPRELAHDPLAHAGERAVDRVAQLGRQLRRADRRDVGAASEVELALEVAEHVRGLVGGDLADLLADVVVELLDRDAVVLVAVGLARLEPLDDGGREHGRVAGPRQLLALERVLHRARRGEDHAAVAAEVVVEVDAVAAAEGQAARDRAAVAAVEQRDHLARAAAGHLPADELRGHRGGVELGDLGVGRSEVQVAAVVLEAVAGEVQEQQVVARALGEERGDPAAQRGLRLVDSEVDLEVADLGVVQHARERLGVGRRRAQAAQLRVVVAATGDDQSEAAGHGADALTIGAAVQAGCSGAPRRPRASRAGDRAAARGPAPPSRSRDAAPRPATACGRSGARARRSHSRNAAGSPRLEALVEVGDVGAYAAVHSCAATTLPIA